MIMRQPITKQAQFWYLCELFYVLTNCLLKFAIGYFYLRVAIERWHIWCIRILMAGTILCGLIYFFLVLLQCLPSEKALMPVTPTVLTKLSICVLECAPGLEQVYSKGPYTGY